MKKSVKKLAILINDGSEVNTKQYMWAERKQNDILDGKKGVKWKKGKNRKCMMTLR
jgi:hypothetical protein